MNCGIHTQQACKKHQTNIYALIRKDAQDMLNEKATCKRTLASLEIGTVITCEEHRLLRESWCPNKNSENEIREVLQ